MRCVPQRLVREGRALPRRDVSGCTRTRSRRCRRRDRRRRARVERRRAGRRRLVRRQLRLLRPVPARRLGQLSEQADPWRDRRRRLRGLPRLPCRGAGAGAGRSSSGGGGAVDVRRRHDVQRVAPQRHARRRHGLPSWTSAFSATWPSSSRCGSASRPWRSRVARRRRNLPAGLARTTTSTVSPRTLLPRSCAAAAQPRSSRRSRARAR